MSDPWEVLPDLLNCVCINTHTHYIYIWALTFKNLCQTRGKWGQSFFIPASTGPSRFRDEGLGFRL